MRLSELFFGKSLNALDIKDIETYFLNPQEESDKIEFKSYELHSNSKKSPADRLADILKTITAMLNSAGGVIIWGAPTTKVSDQNVNCCFGDLTPFSQYYEKDQFIAITVNNIIPAPQGINFHQLSKGGSYIYVIEVEPSKYAPHQYKNIYFMRMDGSTKAAPHHYIDAMFKRISFPNLEAYLRINEFKFSDIDLAELRCSIIFRNMSPFQNDYNLHYRIFSSLGCIVANGDILASSIPWQRGKAGDYQNSKVADTIYYGNWLHDDICIFIERKALYEDDYTLHIRVQFGAKHSPMKLCHYKIIIGERISSNLQDHIVEIAENRFFNIYEDELTVPDKERLMQTLGRRI